MSQTAPLFETALQLTEARSIERLFPSGRHPISRLYFGNEFCDRLIPSSRDLLEVLAFAGKTGLAFSLVTPSVTDSGIDSLGRLFQRLPPRTEVIVNDWGVLRYLNRWFGHLQPVAGRLLSKMLKDPRLPSREWAERVPHGAFAPELLAVVGSFGVERLELDLPPHARPEDFRLSSMRISLHTPYGFAARGRVCRTGSSRLPEREKFVPGERCRKECLDYVLTMTRGNAGARDLPTFQRGTALFYRYSLDMEATLEELKARAAIDRLVVSGDWNESRGAA